MKNFFWYVCSFAIFLTSSINAATPAFWLSVKTNQTTYQVKEPIAISLTVLNIDSNPIKVQFSSAKKYDFYLHSENKLIWKWSDGKMYAQSLSSGSLEPNKPLNYVVLLDPKTLLSKKLQPGLYKLTGAFITSEKEWTSPPINIEIQK